MTTGDAMTHTHTHTHMFSLSLPPFIWRNAFGADVYLLSFLFNLFRFCFVFFLEALVSFLSVQFPLEHFRDCSYGLERKTGREQTGSQRQQRCGESRTGSVKRGQRRWGCRKRWSLVSCPRQMRSTTSLTSGEDTFYHQEWIMIVIVCQLS